MRTCSTPCRPTPTSSAGPPRPSCTRAAARALSRKLLALLGLNEEGVELTAVPLPALWPRLHAACPDVTLRTPAAAPTVRGDADLLLDLLCNLVQNAAKASAPGAPVLVLCAQAGDAVTLTVADRGCGIPPELIPA